VNEPVEPTSSTAVRASADPAATDGMDAASGPARPVNNPTDTSLAAVLGELEREGFAGQFAPLEGGDIRCVTCRETFPASKVPADAVRRLEGVSDPADMMIVVPLSCPHCATKGTLTAHFGPDAGPEDADVVAALPRSPGGGGQGPGSTS